VQTQPRQTVSEKGNGTEVKKARVSSRGKGFISVLMSWNLWSVAHSLADCNELFSSAISAEIFLPNRAELRGCSA
jgi:hypothetical protein